MESRDRIKESQAILNVRVPLLCGAHFWTNTSFLSVECCIRVPRVKDWDSKGFLKLAEAWGSYLQDETAYPTDTWHSNKQSWCGQPRIMLWVSDSKIFTELTWEIGVPSNGREVDSVAWIKSKYPKLEPFGSLLVTFAGCRIAVTVQVKIRLWSNSCTTHSHLS